MKKRGYLRINKMRVCFLTTSYPLYPGDYSGIFIFELAKNLLFQDVEVEVVAPHDNGCKTHEVTSGITVYRFRYFYPTSLEQLAYRGGIVPHLRKSFIAKLQLPFFLLSFFKKTLSIARRCDVIHVHWIQNGLIALLCKIFYKRPVVLTVHGTDINELSKGGLMLKINHFILKRVDRIIAVSKDVEEKIHNLDIPPSKIINIPNGIPNQEIFFNLPDKASISYSLLFVGRLVPLKNLELLLKAVAHLKDKLPKINLIIVGDGPLYAKLKSYAEELQILDYVRFEGGQPREKIYNYFQNADIFILPSATEGFSIVILEALAAGKPVISTKVGIAPEIIKHKENGILIEAGDLNALEKYIYLLLTDNNLMRKISVNARKTIGIKYNWQEIAGKTKGIYQQLV